MLRVVFIGSSRFGLRCLEALAAIPNVTCTGVITNPETFAISYAKEGVKNVLHANVAQYAQAQDIPVYTMQKNMQEPELMAHLSVCKPDIILVVGWYHMVPRSIIETVPTYGMHASLLPDYSGGAPLVWAIINGEKETGITLFQFADGVDNGPVLGQLKTPIGNADTIKTLYDRIEDLGLELLRAQLPLLQQGTAKLTVQDESKRRLFPQRKPEDGRIDWNKPADAVYDFIRAQTRPYPGAFTMIGEDKLSIWESSVTAKQPTAAVGTLLVEAEHAYVVCGDGRVLALRAVSINGADVALQALAPHHAHAFAPKGT